MDQLQNDQQKKDKKTITILSVILGILAFILVGIIIGLIYFYSRLRQPFQELITSGKMPPEIVMRMIFKD